MMALGILIPLLMQLLDKRRLDAAFVRQREQLVTRGYRRLKEIRTMSRDTPIQEYPLPEVKATFDRAR